MHIQEGRTLPSLRILQGLFLVALSVVVPEEMMAPMTLSPTIMEV